MSSIPKPRYTPEQYLDLERRAERKSEYFDGQIFEMSGATYNHNVIASNTLIGLQTRLRGGPCRAVGSDMRVFIRPSGLFTYPDVVVHCGPPEFYDGRSDTLVNPSLIVEVLAPSTEAYDRGEKFALYRRLESLRDYILIAQNRPRIDHFAREGTRWVLTAVDGAGSTLSLPTIGVELGLVELYEGVDLPGPEGIAAHQGTQPGTV